MQYDLVFEGGGAKGFAVGALQAFEEAGHTAGRARHIGGRHYRHPAGRGHETTDADGARGARGRWPGPSSLRSLSQPGKFSDLEINDGALRKLLVGIDIPGILERIERTIDERIIRGWPRAPGSVTCWRSSSGADVRRRRIPGLDAPGAEHRHTQRPTSPIQGDFLETGGVPGNRQRVDAHRRGYDRCAQADPESPQLAALRRVRAARMSMSVLLWRKSSGRQTGASTGAAVT